MIALKDASLKADEVSVTKCKRDQDDGIWQFKVGDVVELDGYRGIVQEIGTRSTVLLGRSNNIKIVSNRDVRNVVNMTKLSSSYFLTVKVPANVPLETYEAILNREQDYFDVKYYVNREIWLALEKEGIRLTYFPVNPVSPDKNQQKYTCGKMLITKLLRFVPAIDAASEEDENENISANKNDCTHHSDRCDPQRSRSAGQRPLY